MSARSTPSVLVSVIIKALNEERRIAACIESALQATAGLSAEIILVDSLSTDRTVAIASGYPVRIVQFERREDRGCGAAVELGWRHAQGEHVYVLDADMQLQSGFLQSAIDYLKQHPTVAGVAGNLVDTHLRTLADRKRARTAAALTEAREVEELGGGGLYRRSAIAEVGYLAHSSLAAYEEAELGVRLRAQGWRLVRLPETAVLHEGHAESNHQMLARLWANGRAKSAAVFLKSAWGRPWFSLVLRKLWHILAVPLVHVGALATAGVVALQPNPPAGMSAALAGVLAWFGYWGLFVGALATRRRSLREGVWQLTLWHYWAAGTLAGMGQPVGDPHVAMAARELHRTERVVP